MYHIKKDKRSQTSAQEIATGFLSCLRTTPLNAITVSDIHRATGISRATFYRLFDTPEDVLHYRFDQMLAESTEETLPQSDESPLSQMEQTVTLALKHHEILKALVDNGRFDLLYLYTEKLFRIQEFSAVLSPSEVSSVELSYIRTQLSMSMVATIITWSQNGYRESPSDIVKILKKHVRIVSKLVEKA